MDETQTRDVTTLVCPRCGAALPEMVAPAAFGAVAFAFCQPCSRHVRSDEAIVLSARAAEVPVRTVWSAQTWAERGPETEASAIRELAVPSEQRAPSSGPLAYQDVRPVAHAFGDGQGTRIGARHCVICGRPAHEGGRCPYGAGRR